MIFGTIPMTFAVIMLSTVRRVLSRMNSLSRPRVVWSAHAIIPTKHWYSLTAGPTIARVIILVITFVTRSAVGIAIHSTHKYKQGTIEIIERLTVIRDFLQLFVDCKRHFIDNITKYSPDVLCKRAPNNLHNEFRDYRWRIIWAQRVFS